MKKKTRLPEAIFVLVCSIILILIGRHALDEGQIMAFGSRTGRVIEWIKHPKYFYFLVSVNFMISALGIIYGLALIFKKRD